MGFPFDAVVTLIARVCNADGDSVPMIRQRLYETRQRGTYRVRFNMREELIGFCDYDCSEDGIVHVRKLIALQPGVITLLVSDLKRTLPWKRVFFYRAKLQAWRHHANARRTQDAIA